jgi:hypothetical protein
MSTTRVLLQSAITLAVAIAATAARAADEESTTLSVKMFGDFTHASLENDGVDQPASGTGIDVKRFYFGVLHNFDKTWAVNLTTDFNYVSNDGETQIYVKKAYAQAKVSDLLIGRLGASDTPWVPFVEDIYRYRYLELEITDRLKFGTSSDWGLSASGKTMGGGLNYAFSVLNGGGYKNPTRSSTMDAEGRIGWAPTEGLMLAAGFYNGKLGKDITNSLTPALHTAQRYTALAAYEKKGFRVGLEYFSADNWFNVTTAAEDKAAGYSFWAFYDFTPRYGILVRYDDTDLSKTVNPSLEDKYYYAGFAVHARKNIDFSIVYKNEQVNGGTWNTSNGLIGGVVSGGKFDEIGLWTEVKF